MASQNLEFYAKLSSIEGNSVCFDENKQFLGYIMQML